MCINRKHLISPTSNYHDVDADDAIDDCTDAGVDLDCHKIIVLRTKQDIAHQRSPIQKRNRILQGGKKSAVPSLR